jgi:hypothetical protein
MSHKRKRRGNQLGDKSKQKQTQGEEGNITSMNNETESTLKKTTLHNTTVKADSEEKAENHHQK